MKAFIVGMGRSGTMWVARALEQCTDLEARHESMRKKLGADFHGVESNSNFWNQLPGVRERFPEAAILHQVRDGRDVVRSVQSRKDASWPFRRSCERWQNRNALLLREIPATHRFRLEDLTTNFDVFAAMASLAGAMKANRKLWNVIRRQRVNAFPHHFHAYGDWSAEERDTFWEVCGETMQVLGYPSRTECDG